ncbi:hypothetical protein AVEN_197794-1 [Araneus ventricosus]|uniref:Uncharacterized protein n=1 Tax=Araneus ventricosus TaxID=182803 RepID=A0A4Y2HMX1_ARAVE|nr:hypothetical protein AVEN_197794-1 [Araneus ventricosus]
MSGLRISRKSEKTGPPHSSTDTIERKHPLWMTIRLQQLYSLLIDMGSIVSSSGSYRLWFGEDGSDCTCTGKRFVFCMTRHRLFHFRGTTIHGTSLEGTPFHIIFDAARKTSK